MMDNVKKHKNCICRIACFTMNWEMKKWGSQIHVFCSIFVRGTWFHVARKLWCSEVRQTGINVSEEPEGGRGRFLWNVFIYRTIRCHIPGDRNSPPWELRTSNCNALLLANATGTGNTRTQTLPISFTECHRAIKAALTNPHWVSYWLFCTLSNAWTVFARSNTRVVGSDPTRGMDDCLFCLCCPVCKLLCIGLRKWKSGQNSTKGCTDIDGWMNEFCTRCYFMDK
jgi:hypothetical protein